MLCAPQRPGFRIAQGSEDSMKRNTKIILSIFTALALLVVVAAGLAVWFVARNADGWLEQGKGRMEAGQAAGAALDSAGCVDRALADYKRDAGPISAVSVRLWLDGCLQTAEVDAGICPEMKADNTLGRMGELIAWRQTFCARHGLATDQNCQQLAAGVEEFCFTSRSPP